MTHSEFDAFPIVIYLAWH